MSRHVVVAIDGPAATGKSTVARQVAERLGYGYVPSGAIYRALAWRVSAGVPLATALAATRIEFLGRPAEQRVLVDQEDVTVRLSSEAVSRLAAELSQRPEVRAMADALQRTIAAAGSVVVEGRDAGTIVFPDADCKFFLDACLEARAQRRLRELIGRGETARLDQVRDALAHRDATDQRRELAPLSRAPDATYIDSSKMTAGEVVDLVLKEVERVCSTTS